MKIWYRVSVLIRIPLKIWKKTFQRLFLTFSFSISEMIFNDTSWPDSKLSDLDRMSMRIQLLSNVCRTYSDPFRPESIVLTETPRSLGVEVVYLHSTQANKLSSVCIPHKVLKINILLFLVCSNWNMICFSFQGRFLFLGSICQKSPSFAWFMGSIGLEG